MRIAHLILGVLVAGALLCIVSMFADLLKASRYHQADDLMQVLAVQAAGVSR